MARDDIKLRLGVRIKDLRVNRDLSQEQLAHLIQMDRSYLASIEVGRRNVTLLNLAKIAHGLDISLSELFEGIVIHEEDLELTCKSTINYGLVTSLKSRK